MRELHPARARNVVVALVLTFAVAVVGATVPVGAQAGGDVDRPAATGEGGFRPCGPDTCVYAGAREQPAGPVRAPRSGRAPVRVLRYYEDCGPDFEVALVVALVDVETGQRYEQSRTCPAPLAGDPALADIPPTPQEIWRLVPLWQPTAALSPACRGVVGRPTAAWAAASPAVGAEVVLGDQTWSVTAEPVGWRIEVAPESGGGADRGDAGAPLVLAAADPGAADRPLGELVPTTKGRAVVRATETWTGSYTGPGGTFTLDYVDVSALAATYRVLEIQAVVVGPGGRADDPSAALACGQ